MKNANRCPGERHFGGRSGDVSSLAALSSLVPRHMGPGWGAGTCAVLRRAACFVRRALDWARLRFSSIKSWSGTIVHEQARIRHPLPPFSSIETSTSSIPVAASHDHNYTSARPATSQRPVTYSDSDSNRSRFLSPFVPFSISISSPPLSQSRLKTSPRLSAQYLTTIYNCLRSRRQILPTAFNP
ncbi:hypothetical protein ANO11243_005680 [Dothideomycetidae sp. 11243]|nr:hypothetical protein ANO11243_005680 [fungal sp. No.11243]